MRCRCVRAILWLFVLCVCSTPPRADSDAGFSGMYASFVTVDAAAGLFHNADGDFALPCATYVQPAPGKPGTNSGETSVFMFDLTRLRPDFRHMRECGIHGVYMRIGPGFFLNADGSWRKVDAAVDAVVHRSIVGIVRKTGLQEQIEANFRKAAAAGIGPFTYDYQLFDYLLAAAKAEGIYVVPMIMDGWDLPRKVELEENATAILYDDAWQRQITDWTKILQRYADRKEILGYLFEGETFSLPPWASRKWFMLGPGRPRVERVESPLESKDPRLTKEFQDFLQRRYGNIETLKARWGLGYNHSRPDYRTKAEIPFYPYDRAAFSGIHSFADVPLPSVEKAKGQEGEIGPGKGCPWFLNIPFDPVWEDFGYFKEELYTRRLNQFVAAMRTVDAHHPFLLDAALDSVPVWHPFFVAWDHGRIHCDVQLHGGGYTKAVRDAGIEFPVHDTAEELFQSVAPYRPYARAGLMGLYGMGEGGLDLESNNPKSKTTPIPESAQDRWIAGIFMDNFGSGSGFANLWDWGSLTGATTEQPQLHDHQVLKTTRKIADAVQDDTFTRTRKARVLILSDGPTLRSLMKPMAYDNMAALASALTATHCLFDMLTTDEIAFGHVPGKVDISAYDAIFMPQQFQIALHQLSAWQTVEWDNEARNPWRILRQWLEAKPHRVLCVGCMSLRDEYFNPLDKVPFDVTNVLGEVTFSPLAIADGHHVWGSPSGGALDVELNRTPVQTIQIDQGATDVKPFLTDAGKIVATERMLANGSRACFCGFPLGLSWMYLIDNDLSGGGSNDKFNVDKVGQFYGRLIAEAGVKPDYDAPPSIVAYISDHARDVFLRQRFTNGPRQGELLSSPLLAGKMYADVETVQRKKGANVTGSLSCDLGDNYAAVIHAVGTVDMLSDGTVTITMTRGAEGKIKVTVVGDAAADIRFGGINRVFHHAAGKTEVFSY